MVFGDIVHVKQKKRLLSSKEEEYEGGGKRREVVPVQYRAAVWHTALVE